MDLRPSGWPAPHLFGNDRLGAEGTLESFHTAGVIRREIDRVVGRTACRCCSYDRFDCSYDRLRRWNPSVCLQISHERIPDTPVNADAEASMEVPGADFIYLSEH